MRTAFIPGLRSSRTNDLGGDKLRHTDIDLIGTLQPDVGVDLPVSTQRAGGLEVGFAVTRGCHLSFGTFRKADPQFLNEMLIGEQQMTTGRFDD